MQLVLADGMNLIRRLYAAVEQQPTAIESTIARAASILHQQMSMVNSAVATDADAVAPRTGYLALVMEDQQPTWRHELWPDYKKGRAPMPESLAEQLPQLLQQLKNHGIPQIKIDGWEADDVIATMAVKGRHYGLQVTILSTDKGFCQLVDDSIRVRNHFDQITFDLETVRGRWGFEPHQLPDFWALTGDTTNHLPGVSGIGRKGAADIMSAAGNLNRAFAFPQLITDKQSQLLQQHWHSAILTRELATLSTNVPLTQKLSEFRYRPNL